MGENNSDSPSTPNVFTEKLEIWALRCSAVSCCAAGDPGSEGECGGDDNSGEELERGVELFALAPSTPDIS